MENSRDLGAKIKQARKEKGISQRELAQLVGLTKSTIQRYESSNITDIKIVVIDAIAKALNVSPEWLIGKSCEKAAPNWDGLREILNKLDEADIDEVLKFVEYLHWKHTHDQEQP